MSCCSLCWKRKRPWSKVQLPKVGKGKEKDSLLEPLKRNGALFIPWILPSESCVGFPNCRIIKMLEYLHKSSAVFLHEELSHRLHLFFIHSHMNVDLTDIYFIFWVIIQQCLTGQTLPPLIIGSSFSWHLCLIWQTPFSVCMCMCVYLASP